LAPQNVLPTTPANAPIPAVGSVPPNFNDLPTSYSHSYILDLMIFYNDDFGIVLGDSIADRMAVLHKWLTGF
jgi:hypothetical protein